MGNAILSLFIGFNILFFWQLREKKDASETQHRVHHDR